MYSPVQLGIKFAKYYLTADNGKGHGIHSPFTFDFVINVLNDNRTFYAYEAIEKLRLLLLQNENRTVSSSTPVDRSTWTLTKKPYLKSKVFTWGAVVEEVRTVFERTNDATIYIPNLMTI